jgi:ABC-type transport system involved in multi-copper enzyme maturation permease subunit
MIQLRGFLRAGRHAALTGLRGKRLLVLAFLALLPLLAMLSVGRGGEPIKEQAFHGIFHLLILQFVVPFSALFLGNAVLGDELEGRTVTYLFTRPVDRGLLYLGRFFGTGLSFTVILALLVGAALNAREIALGQPNVDRGLALQLSIAGFWVYFGLFACLRTLLRRALLFGMAYILILDLMISKAPYVGLAKLSIWHQLMVVYLGSVDTAGSSVHSMSYAFHADETAAGAWMFLAGTFVVSVLLGAWFTRTREYHVAGAVA